MTIGCLQTKQQSPTFLRSRRSRGQTGPRKSTLRISRVPAKAWQKARDTFIRIYRMISEWNFSSPFSFIVTFSSNLVTRLTVYFFFIFPFIKVRLLYSFSSIIFFSFLFDHFPFRTFSSFILYNNTRQTNVVLACALKNYLILFSLSLSLFFSGSLQEVKKRTDTLYFTVSIIITIIDL